MSLLAYWLIAACAGEETKRTAQQSGNQAVTGEVRAPTLKLSSSEYAAVQGQYLVVLGPEEERFAIVNRAGVLWLEPWNGVETQLGLRGRDVAPDARRGSCGEQSVLAFGSDVSDDLLVTLEVACGRVMGGRIHDSRVQRSVMRLHDVVEPRWHRE